MLVRLLRWFQGYLLVQINGYSPERFLNLCRNHKLLIWNLKKLPDGFVFNMSLQSYLSLRPIARKTKTLPLVKKRYGFPFYFRRFKKRKAFFFGVAVAAIIVYVMSLFIWDVSITGQYTNTEEGIVQFLRNSNVYAGVMKKSINCQQIEDMIRKEYNDIGWVSAEIRGTRLLIKVTETNMPKPYEKQSNPCHIIANKDGIIMSIVTRVGSPKVREGDTVKKGDIIISGVVDVIGDDQTVKRKVPVVADADVVIKSYYEYEDHMNMNYVKKEYTNHKKQYYCLGVWGKKFYILNPFKNYDGYNEYDELVSESNLRINKNFYLPISWSKIQYVEYKSVDQVYTEEEAREIAEKKLDRYIEELRNRDVEVVENRVETSFEGDECVTKGRIIVYEPVTDTQTISSDETYIEPTPTPVTEP